MPKIIPKKRLQRANMATIMIVEAIIATMPLISVSRFFTWPSSCCITPASSRSVSRRMIPVVAATAACCGLRPVAKALGTGVSTT